MTNLFELKKGNPENLEGRVLVYTHYTSEEVEKGLSPEYPALYSATNSVDIEAFMPDIPKKIIQEIKMHEALIEGKNSIDSFVHIYFKTALENLDKIEKVPGDVLYAGEASDSTLVDPLLHSLTDFYMLLYQSQLNTKSKIDKFINATLGNANDSFKNYKGSEIMPKLEHILDKIKEAHKKKDIKEESNYLFALKKFTEGSSFYPSVIQFIDTLHKNFPEDLKTKLLDSYHAEMVAVHCEDYEMAGLMKNKIDKLLLQIPDNK